MDSNDLKNLVEEIKNGNELSFRKFFDYFYPRFLRIAFYYIHEHETAEELVMDVFVKLWKNRQKLPEILNFNNYAYTAVKNQALKYIHKKKLNIKSLDNLTSSKMIEYIEPEMLFIGKELAIELEKTVQLLPPRCQITYRMVREDGLKYKEVAEILNISQKAIENQMLIAAKRIRTVFEKYVDRSSSKRYLNN